MFEGEVGFSAAPAVVDCEREWVREFDREFEVPCIGDDGINGSSGSGSGSSCCR